MYILPEFGQDQLTNFCKTLHSTVSHILSNSCGNVVVTNCALISSRPKHIRTSLLSLGQTLTTLKKHCVRTYFTTQEAEMQSVVLHLFPTLG